MTDLALLVEAGGAAWEEADAFAAHEWWEAAWLRQPDGPLREGLRALTQWAAAAHLDVLGRCEAALTIRARARQRFRRTENRLALAPFALDLPSDEHDNLVLRDKNDAFAVTAVLLAAGHGRRAGGPKALIAVDGQPLWQRQVQRLRLVGLTRAIAVLPPSARLAAAPPLRICHGDPDGTPLHSLQRALALTPGPVLLLPVDCPAPARGVVVRLLAAGVRDPKLLAVRPIVATPTGPRGGHPLWLAAATCQQLLALDANAQRLDRFLHTLGAAYGSVAVADSAVLGNFNQDGVAR